MVAKKKKTVARRPAAKAKTNGVKAKRRGRPPSADSDVWKTVLRLPGPLARKLKRVAKRHDMSINSAVETVVSIWVKSEGV